MTKGRILAEGMLGVAAAMDSNPPTSATMVQGETEMCFRMHVDTFRREMDRRGAYYELVSVFAQVLVAFIMQSTACSAMHSVEQRLARWFLMAHDWMESNSFPLTQEFVAMMRVLSGDDREVTFCDRRTRPSRLNDAGHFCLRLSCAGGRGVGGRCTQVSPHASHS